MSSRGKRSVEMTLWNWVPELITAKPRGYGCKKEYEE
jgi:hypothetical protein